MYTFKEKDFGIVYKNDLEKYIILFPFCSAHLQIKKWPYYNELIELIKSKYKDKYK